MSNRRGQVWVFDLMLGLFIFTSGFFLYLQNDANLSYFRVSSLDDLHNDATLVGDSLLSAGYPANWNSSNVVKIGLLNFDSKLNISKLDKLNALSYSMQKSLMGVTNDFIYYFKDDDNISGVLGECYRGMDNNFFSVDTKYAYYSYYANNDTNYFKSSMTDVDAIFYDKGNEAGFAGAILGYDAIVLENPRFDDMAGGTVLNLITFLNNGGSLFIIGDHGSSDSLGVEFNDAAFSFSNVSVKENYLNLDYGTVLNSTGYEYCVEDNVATDYISISTFPDGCDMIAKWKSGTGEVYYFSSANILLNGTNTNISINVENLFFEKTNMVCSLNETLIDYDNIFKLSRYVNKDNDIVGIDVLVFK